MRSNWHHVCIRTRHWTQSRPPVTVASIDHTPHSWDLAQLRDQKGIICTDTRIAYTKPCADLCTGHGLLWQGTLPCPASVSSFDKQWGWWCIFPVVKTEQDNIGKELDMVPNEKHATNDAYYCYIHSLLGNQASWGEGSPYWDLMDVRGRGVRGGGTTWVRECAF